MAKKIGPWPAGLDNLSPDTEIPASALRTADDVLIEDSGTVKSGVGPRLAVAAPGLSSLWQSSAGACYGVIGSDLYRVTLGGVVEIGNVGAAAGAASFAEFAGKPIVCTDQGCFWIKSQAHAYYGSIEVAEPVALPPPSFTASSVDGGGLPEGRYFVAVAAMRDGELFGVSEMAEVVVPDKGGIIVNIAGGGQAMVYRTEPNGENLYAAGIAGGGLPKILGNENLGAMPGSRYMDQMSGGHIARSFSGRLLVARGRTLYYSQPMRPALCDPRHDFIQLPSRITMVAPVQDGVFIADQRRSYFLSGTDPDEWSLLPLDAPAPGEGCFTTGPGNLFSEVSDVTVAVWLGASGIVIGLPGGQVTQRQADRLLIPNYPAGSMLIHDRRIFALAH